MTFDPGTWRGRKVLLGVTGSLAAAAMPQAVAALRLAGGADVRVVTTPAAASFVTSTALAAAAGRPVVCDGATDGLTVSHVELAGWADLVLVMPATANVLAQAALGLAPDLLTTVLLAAACPVVMVPSMNAAMWSKPAVQRNVATLRADGIGVVDPVAGLSLGDSTVGPGAMPPLADVLDQAAPLLRARTERVDVAA